MAKTICPICNVIINLGLKGRLSDERKYCSCCGLPLKVKCPSEHADIKVCVKCYSLNPAEANYCRCCGKDIRLSGVEFGHGWVDLGLSVLWSTETMSAYFQWMDSKNCLWPDSVDFSFVHYKGNGKDTASSRWGNKWRMPTKEEFEELIIKCRWEKTIIAETGEHALKITGPSGEHIFIKFTEQVEQKKIKICLSYYRFWTSTEDSNNPDRAFAFSFRKSKITEEEFKVGIEKIPQEVRPIVKQTTVDKMALDDTIRKLDNKNDENYSRVKKNEEWLTELGILNVASTHKLWGFAIRPVMDKE